MAQDIVACDVLIQAGHENTPDNMTGGAGPLGKEIDWTPIVANEAVRLLKEAGINAIKETAHIKATHQHYRCKLALFIHFDAPDTGEAGPSVGYHHSSDADAADEWKALYKEFFPYKDTWLRDNATKNEEYYYGFRYTMTSDAEFVVELGDLASLRQARWLEPRLKWLGQLIAYFVSHRLGRNGIPKPVPFQSDRTTPPSAITVKAKRAGASVRFTTEPSASGNARGHSKTKGLQGTRRKYDDGSVVTEATEALSADRVDGLRGTLTASCHRVDKDGIGTVEQSNYSYKQRELPNSTLFYSVSGVPDECPPGFRATSIKKGKATQFGKHDTQDEGTGSPLMGLIQTNSDVFGASVKISIMSDVFGTKWKTNEKRLGALLDVHSSNSKKMVRVPLVDVGPAEHATSHADVDLTWASDQFLETHGGSTVQYRMLVPSDSTVAQPEPSGRGQSAIHPPDGGAELGVVKTAPDDPLNVRTSPSLKSDIIATLYDGAKVVILRAKTVGRQRWLQIALDGNNGWVSKKFIQVQ